MIASIRGEVLSASVGSIVVGIGSGGGVGLRVEVPSRLTGLHPGAQVSLHTHLVVREDSLTLFGFETVEELEVFGVLLGVSGVGPRSALGVLSELTPAEVAQAVANEDEKPFRRAPGIGPKTAKLITVQLAGKLHIAAFAAAVNDAGESIEAGADSRMLSTVEQGLLGLGYTETQAHQAVRDAVEAGAPADEAGLLRAALLLLQAPRIGVRSSTNSVGGR